MKAYFDVPPSDRADGMSHGWPGDAAVTAEVHKSHGRICGAVRIVACAQAGGWSYRLELQPGQLIALALRMWVARVQVWWGMRK